MSYPRLFIVPPIILGLIALFSFACAPTGVGDPCEPEVQFEGTLSAGETVVETSSLQCRTRVCMTYNDHSFCTKRCTNDEDCNAEWYEEGPGEDDIPRAACAAEVTVGAPGVQGEYCVPNRALRHDNPTE